MRSAVNVMGCLAMAGLAAACSRNPKACMSPGTCGEGYECLANRCVVAGGQPVSADARRLILHPTQLAWLSSRGHREPGPLPPAFTFGSQSEGAATLLLSFDAELDGQLESAFLLLDPVAGLAPAAEDVAVEAWRIGEPWDENSASWVAQPSLELPKSNGIARAAPPSPLRIDVTRLFERDKAKNGIALRSTDSELAGCSFASGVAGGEGPRVELYVR